MDEKDLEKILKALANKRRILILRVLKGRKKASVNDLAKTIKLSFRSTSKHLSILYAAGILDKEQSGLTVFYSIDPKPEKVILHLLSII
ncbi:MAG TPA: metalloregulator ArsR/SmtB family transcription factor [Candidatus Paceibacterota bacterium]